MPLFGFCWRRHTSAVKGFLNWKASRYFGGDARSHLPSHFACKLEEYDDGLIPGGGEGVSSGRAHNYFADRQISDEGYVSGVRAQRAIEIRVAMKEAVLAGIIFIETASEGILTRDTIPP